MTTATKLRDTLFDAIEQVKEGKLDIKNADSIARLGHVIISSAKTEIDAARWGVEVTECDFFK